MPAMSSHLEGTLTRGVNEATIGALGTVQTCLLLRLLSHPGVLQWDASTR